MDKPGAADKLVGDVIDAVERLTRFPKSGRSVPETEGNRYREVILPPCRVIYRLTTKEVFIIAVMRGEALLHPSVLEREDA